MTAQSPSNLLAAVFATDAKGVRVRNLVLACLAQNFALGMTYGTYGAILRSIEADFEVSRAVASTGMSVMLLILGLLSPFVGKLLQRVSIRALMISGALINGIANLVMAFAPDVRILLCGYAILGAGTCLLGIIAPTTLVSRWYDSGRGRALGIVNLPLVLPIAPLAMTAILPGFGLSGGFVAMAAVNLFLAPLFFLVVDHPGGAGNSPGPLDQPRKQPQPGLRLSLKPILLSPDFWLLTLGNAILTGAGTIFVVHFIAFAGSRGLPLSEAAVIVTGYGLSGLFGTLAFGWLADKIAPSRALCLNAILSAGLWTLMLLTSGFSTMLLLGCLIGCCTTALVALLGAATSKVFGVAYVSSVMGITYFFKLPFLFGAAPLVGFLFDRTGSYTQGFLITIIAFICAAIAFILVKPSRASRSLAT